MARAAHLNFLQRMGTVAAGVPPAVEGARLAARNQAKQFLTWSCDLADAAGRDAPALRQARRLPPQVVVPRAFADTCKNLMRLGAGLEPSRGRAGGLWNVRRNQAIETVSHKGIRVFDCDNPVSATRLDVS
jgi:hypothetical protein